MIVHRYWTGGWAPVNLSPQRFHEVIDWTDETLPAVVLTRADATAEQVRAADRVVHRSNVVRWWLLALFGGVWLDHDVTVHEPLPDGVWVAAHGGPCTCAMRFPLHHPVPLHMCALVDRQPPSERHSYDVSGECVVELTPDVQLIPLPYYSTGRRQEGATNWITHGYASLGTR